MNPLEENNSEASGTILSHLFDLFASLKYFLIFMGFGMGVGYIFSEPILSWMTTPYYQVMGPDSKLIFLSPFEKIWVHMRVALWSGIFIALPGMFWSLFRFVAPAISQSIRESIWKMLFVFWAILWLGIWFGQKYSIPVLLKAVTQFKSLNEAPFIALEPYVGMSLGVLLATAILFELPILMFYLSRMGWVSSQTWASSRKTAIVSNALVSAILSPPDIVSMVVLMIPIHLLYELGVFMAFLGGRKTKS